MRRRWVYRDGIAYEIGEQVSERTGPDVMPDIAAYRSMIDGRMITSRSQHREHLRDHGCFEIGNETAQALRQYQNIPDVAPQQRHDLIAAQVNAMRDSELKRAIKRDVDRIKWNSRTD